LGRAQESRSCNGKGEAQTTSEEEGRRGEPTTDYFVSLYEKRAEVASLESVTLVKKAARRGTSGKGHEKGPCNKSAKEERGRSKTKQPTPTRIRDITTTTYSEER